MSLKTILENLDAVTAEYSNGYGEKENAIFNILKDNNIQAFFIKEQGFIIPSKNKPNKVVSVHMPHHPSFNTSFRNNMNYNIQKNNGESLIKGGLSDSLAVSILLEVINQNKELLEDTIFIFTDGKYNSFSGLPLFIDTINKELRKELLFINLTLSTEKTIDRDFIIKANNTSFDLVKKLENELNYNFKFEKEKTDTNLKYVETKDLIGFNMALPILGSLYGFQATTTFFNIERYFQAITNILKLSFDIKSMEIDSSDVPIEKVAKMKSKKELKKEVEKKENTEHFEQALEGTLIELTNPFNSEEHTFILKYFITKYKKRDTIHGNFLIKKYGKKKVKELINKLLDYEVLKETTDKVYKFL